MKYIGRFLGWILLGINLCMVVLLLVCAYSPYIDPVAHPVWSCAGLAFPAFLIVNLLFLVFWLYKPQNKMFRFYKTFCSRITLINTNQNVILNPI